MAAQRGAGLRRLHSRLQQIQSKLHASPSITESQLAQLQKAIKYETDHQFSNVQVRTSPCPINKHAPSQGRTGTFADFVTASVASLAPAAPTLQALTPTLARYPALSPPERQRVATHLLHVLTALQATHVHSSGLDDADHIDPSSHGAPSKPSTAAFREQFRQRAMAMAAAPVSDANSVVFEGDQRTATWHALRDKRLTASAFANALGTMIGVRIAIAFTHTFM